MSKTPTRLVNRVIKAFDTVGFWHDPYGMYADAVVAQLNGMTPHADIHPSASNSIPNVRKD